MFSRSLLSIKRAIFKDVVERRQIFSICRNNHLPIVGIIQGKLFSQKYYISFLIDFPTQILRLHSGIFPQKQPVLCGIFFFKSEWRTKKLWLACGPCRNHLQDIKTWCGVSWICSLLRRHVLKSKYVAADFSRIYKYTHLSQQDHLRVNNNTGSNNHLRFILQIDRSIRSFQINDHLEQQIRGMSDGQAVRQSVSQSFCLSV